MTELAGMTNKLEDIAVAICATAIMTGLLLLAILYSPGMLLAKLRSKKSTDKSTAHPCVECKFYFGEMGLTCAVNPGSEGLCREFEATN